MSHYRAVVDIGSNSVRLVVYNGPKRAPVAISNEKALCGLGRNVHTTGVIAPEAMAVALETLAQFRILIDEMRIKDVYCVATAAVREAQNRDEFLAKAADMGFKIQILSGKEEARFAAYGVIMADPWADGVVGDLGGGSLELVETSLAHGEGARASLKLGPLWVLNKNGGADATIAKTIVRELDKIDWLTKSRAKTFYIVGGAWRHLSRLGMILQDYPLSILHDYVMSKSDVLRLCGLAKNLSRASLDQIAEIPKKRQETLPYAAILLEEILRRMPSIKNISVSAAGVREGVLFDKLDAAQRAQDPLIEGVADFAGRRAPNPAFGKTMAGFTKSLFGGGSRRERRLCEAASLLCDIGVGVHPDYRGLYAYRKVLTGPWLGARHDERIFMALAVYRRYEGMSGELNTPEAVGLIDDEARAKADMLGAAMRLGATLSPRASGPLSKCALDATDDELVLFVPKYYTPLVTESVRKRLGSLANVMNKTPRVEFTS